MHKHKLDWVFNKQANDEVKLNKIKCWINAKQAVDTLFISYLITTTSCESYRLLRKEMWQKLKLLNIYSLSLHQKCCLICKVWWTIISIESYVCTCILSLHNVLLHNSWIYRWHIGIAVRLLYKIDQAFFWFVWSVCVINTPYIRWQII